MAQKLKIKLNKSMIGASEKQKRIAKALGFSKVNQVVEHDDTATIRGMVNRISHMLIVE
jgi:large subunit ribosomal protein L30